MIPRTFPSTYASNGQQQMVVYFLTSVTGLQRWADYIPVKLTQGGVENSYNNNGYIDVAVLSQLTASTQAWKEYIPVYLDDAATDAWRVNAVGYIPYGYALFNGASMMMDLTNGGNLDPRVTFSRASNATLVNSAGAVAYAPHNLLTFSESFDASAWAKNGGTSIVANTAVAPDGTTTADTLVNATGIAFDTTFRSSNISISAGLAYTASVYVRSAGAATTFSLRLRGSSGSSNITSVAITSEWQRVSVTLTTVAADATVNVMLGGANGDVFLWGAQLNVGALQPYNCTTVENALGFTQEFNNAAWTKTNSTITANATAAPDGSMTADTLTDSLDGAPAAHLISPAAFGFISGTTYTVSVYAKEGTLPGCTLLFPSAAFTSNITARFNLSTGVVAAVDAGVTASIVAVGNGWYRCSATAAATATASGVLQIRIANASASFYQGNGTGTIFIWGAQLSDSASLDPYVYNPAAAFTSTAYYGPRFDYDPVTLAPRGLLIEEQRTNSIRNNTMVGAVAGSPGTAPTNWAVSGSGNGISRDIVSIGTESGINYVDVRFYGTPTAGTSVVIAFEGANSVAASSGQTWTGSAYVALSGGSLSGTSCTLSLLETNGTSGLVDNNKAITPTAGALSVKRDSFTATLSGGASTTNLQPRIRVGYTVGTPIDITLRIGLPQLELGAFATSVIPTTTAAATRAADVATMVGDNFSNWYNQSEGTLFADATPQASTAGGYALIEAGDGTASNRIGLFKLITSGNASLAVLSGGATQASTNNGAWTATGKLAGAYKLDDFASSFNGGSVATDTSGTVPVVNQLTLGRRQDGPNVLNGHLRRVAYFNRRLSNSELQAVTA